MATTVISRGKPKPIVVPLRNNSNTNGDMATTLPAKWKQQPVASCDQTVCDEQVLMDSKKLFWQKPKLR
jgi:hypothetical protein